MSSPSEYTRQAIEAHERARDSALCKRFGHDFRGDVCVRCGADIYPQSETEGMGALVASGLIIAGMVFGAGGLAIGLHLAGVL